MNIFFLDNNLKLCAEYHVDRHAVKMIVELAQMLSSAHRFLDGKLEIVKINNRSKKIYKLNNNDSLIYHISHVNHPCTVWVRESIHNYMETFELFKYLCEEYTYRYGKIHMTDTKLSKILSVAPNNIPNVSSTPKAQAMPDIYKCDDAITAYRNYYIHEKSHLAVWSKRTIPEWYVSINN
jgi:hypothetical protein